MLKLIFFILLSTYWPACSSCQEKKSSEVAIIGAGVAGLTAALRFKEAGIPFTIYESSTRAGGRIWSANLYSPHHVNELGASFIDSNHDATLRLVAELDLKLIDLPKRQYRSVDHVFIAGKTWSREERFDLLKPYFLKMAEHRRNPRELERISLLNVKEYLKILDAPHVMEKIIHAQFTNECGLNLDQINARTLLDEIALDEKSHEAHIITSVGDEAWTIKGGISQLTDALVNEVKDHIRFDRTLVEIKERSNGSYGLVFEQMSKDQPITADYVVITTPKPILRDLKILEGNLPHELQKKIDRAIFGQNDKVFFFYNQPFWRIDNKKTMHLIIDDFELHDSTFDKSDVFSVTLVRGGDKANKPLTNAFTNKIVSALDKLYPGSKQHFKKAMVGLNWPTWVYSQGSYTCDFGPVYRRKKNIVQTPRMKNILFAGELWGQTSQGYVDSAVQSAEIAANSIISEVTSDDAKGFFAAFDFRRLSDE